MSTKVFKILACFGCIFLFNISVVKSEGNILLEAEYAQFKGVSKFPKNDFSGKGYVSGFRNDGDNIEFNFDADEDLYELIIAYRTPLGQKKGYELQVNGPKTAGMFPEGDGLFHEHKAGKYKLHNGRNTVIISKGWGWFDIDYIKLNKTTVQLPMKPPVKLSDSKASPSAKALLAFLVDCYGNKVLSGQQDMADIEHIVSVTGKSPAIACFDLVDYSPSRVQFGSKPEGAVEKWIDWAKKNNGIISLSWHWNAPAELINNAEEKKQWWLGFYTRATNFNLEETLSDKNSKNYQLLISDMDVIAEELKKFQDADVPVLWRPLHEAAGGWFWWGAKGSEPFKELWNLMYDRFTNYHGLHNLIWVYTNNSLEWYPGDATVDIISLDIYADPSSSMSAEWESVQNEFNGKKLVALSESGTLPNPDNIRTYGTWWSWFSVWTGHYLRDAGEDTLKSVYNDKDIITLDKLPDWRSYDATKKISQ